MRIKNIIKKCAPLYRLCMIAVEENNRRKYKVAMEHGNEGLIKLISDDYKKNTGETLRVPPVSYTEKIQFAKMFDSTELKGRLTDKYAVREWVKEKIGEEYLIPLIGAWDHFSDIDFEMLPQSFVLKTNHGSGTNLIVKDKNLIDRQKEKKKFDFWMKEDFAFSGRGYELHYSYIKPKVIAEQYIVDRTGELNDYKFLCFNGEPLYCWVDVGRHSHHRRSVFDLDWKLQPWNQYTYEPMKETIDKPDNFDEMLRLVRILCKGFGQVRVDLYNVDGKIYFGEMTFTNGKGYELIYPKQYNDYLGQLWNQDFNEFLKEK